MKSRSALMVAVIFFIVYGMASTIGSIFLVTWGSGSLFKDVMLFLGSFPIDWNYLIVEKSIFFLFLNIFFWTAVVYVIVLLIGRAIRFQQKKVD